MPAVEPPADASRLAILFDLDGTLHDSLPLILASFHHACASVLGRTFPEAPWIARIGTPLDLMMADYAADPTARERLSDAYRAYYRMHHDERIRAFDGAPELLGELAADAGISIGIVTGKTAAAARRTLAFTGLSAHIGAVVGCDSCPRHKPDPEPVTLARTQARALAARTVFIGDSTLDMRAGVAAGVGTVGVTWGAARATELAEAGAATIVGDMPALRAHLRAWVAQRRARSDAGGRAAGG